MDSIQDTILRPVRLVKSKPYRRAYLQSVLVAVTAALLLFIASTAYLVFYANYIPSIGINKPIHFYYAPSASPSGSVAFDPPELVPDQRYDITLELRVPTSPSNIEHGNFNCDLFIFSLSKTPDMRAPHFFGDIAPAVVETSTLLHSRRPGILTYTTPLLTTLRTLAGSPLLLAGLSRQEETLNIRLADAHVFTTTPLTAVIEIDTGVSVYDARIKFDARFEGIRWLMYHWRLSSFVVFVGLFWGVEMAAAGALWYWVLAWLEVRGAEVEGETGVEGEELVPEDESETGGSGLRFVDTQRTFPTSSRAPRLGLQEGLYPTPEGTPAPESILASEEWTPESGDSRAGDDEEGDTTEFDDDVEELVTLTTDSGIGASDSTGRRVGETDSMRRRRQRLSTGYGFLSGGGGSPGR